MTWYEKIKLWPRQAAMLAVFVYQKTLSPDHGPLKIFFTNGYCKFYPSCSQYGYEALKKFGFWRGGGKALWRILRCNPFSHGGHDPA